MRTPTERDGGPSIDILIAVLRSICDELPKHEQRLNELDAALGDGDHGQTIARCAVAIGGELDMWADGTVAQALASVGMAVVANAGGASGALLGSAFMAAGRTVDDPGLGPRVDAARVADMLDAARRAIAARGHVGPGDKTMLDALDPAASEARRVADANGAVRDAIACAAEAAERGAAATSAMTGRAGRAARLGERSLGHPDPGAVSLAIMLRVAADRLATVVPTADIGLEPATLPATEEHTARPAEPPSGGSEARDASGLDADPDPAG